MNEAIAQPGSQEEIVFPSIVFKVGGEMFSVNSKYVSTILQLPPHQPLPEAPDVVTGVFHYRGSVVTMYDLRTALHMTSLIREFEDFSEMIEARMQDHRDWVDELERCVHDNEEFTLATDPHQCKLGRWRDTFQSEIGEVNHHLHKLDDPHMRLHTAAQAVENCKKDCDNCAREECLKKHLETVRNECMPQVLNLLMETRDVFQNSVYRGIALVLSGDKPLSLVVDEVLSVENLLPAGDETAFRSMASSALIRGLQKSEQLSGLIKEIDVAAVFLSLGADYDDAASL